MMMARRWGCTHGRDAIHVLARPVRYLLQPPSRSAVRARCTVAKAMDEAMAALCRDAVPDPEVSCLHLMAAAMGVPHTAVRAARARKLTPGQLHRFEMAVRRRREDRVPLQYLVGDWDFRHLTLQLRPPVLIPRPETEVLVGLVLAALHAGPARVLEVGCGSGAVCLSLAHEHARATVTALDISHAALDLTAENAARLGLAERLHLVHSDAKMYALGRGAAPFDAVVSNPPYVASADMATLPAELRCDYGCPAL